MMSVAAAAGATLSALDDATRELVRVAAALAAGTDETVRAALQRAAPRVPHAWIEELLLQTYLFAGFPRALNGMREWRRLQRTPSDARVAPLDRAAAEARGVATCARVYGTMYERLRENVRELHPLLDDWMIVEGYGKVLSRPGLDLARRELCIVAACAATSQDRQLQSHLHGARNAGVADDVVSDTIETLRGVITDDQRTRATRMWNRVRGGA